MANRPGNVLFLCTGSTHHPILAKKILPLASVDGISLRRCLRDLGRMERAGATKTEA